MGIMSDYVKFSAWGVSYITNEDYRKIHESNPILQEQLARLRDARLIELGVKVFGPERINNRTEKVDANSRIRIV